MTEREFIIAVIGQSVRTFGGGSSSGSPIAEALRNRPLQFAPGVDVGQVVDIIFRAKAEYSSLVEAEKLEERIKGESKCPKCKKSTLRAKEWSEGGGVVCRDKECGYWFCY